MISIVTGKGKLKFDDQNHLAEFCAESFQKLSREKVTSLLQGLEILSPSRNINPELAADLLLESIKLTVKQIEAHKKAKRTDLALKAPLPETGVQLKLIECGFSDFKELLPHVVRTHAASVGIHDSMHTGTKQVRVGSSEDPHTAVHVLGHISQILMYLPQLKTLPSSGLIKQADPFAGILMPSRELWKPKGFTRQTITTPQNPMAEMIRLVRDGGSLHLK